MSTSPTQSMNDAKKVYAVGDRPMAARSAAKFLSTAMKLGFVVALGVGGWKALGPDASSAPTQDHSRSADVVVAQPTVSHQAPAPLTDLPPLPEPSFDNVQSNVNVSVQDEPNATPARQLPITVEDDDNVSSLAVKMWRSGHAFQAAALQAEGLETKTYYIEGDSTMPTIGVGYNVKKSIGAIGRDGVRRELTQAGIEASTIDVLMNPAHKVSSTGEITKQQAVALLEVATSRFRESTRAAVGAQTFDRLPQHRQASLMWIDYNSNLHKRPNLISAVRNNNTQRAIEEMETWITVYGERMRSPSIVLAQSMYWDEAGLRQAVMNPTQVKRQGQNNALPWQQSTAPDTRYAQNTQLEQAPVTLSGANVRQVAAGVEDAPVAQDSQPPQMNASHVSQFRNMRPVNDPSPAPQSSQSNDADVQKFLDARKALREQNGYNTTPSR